MRLKPAAIVAALLAVLALPVQAGEAAPKGAATALSLLAPDTSKRGILVKRYKKTMLIGWTEHRTDNCKQISPGKWFNVPPSAKYGKVTFGTIRAKAVTGPCVGHTYTYAVLYYEWTRHSNESITDKFGARWKTPDGIYDYLYKIDIDVPVVRPIAESTVFAGWDGKGLGLWRQTLKPPKNDPKFDFSYDTVREADAGHGKDTCWFSGSSIPKFEAITGGTWFPDEKGVWEFDHVGWFTSSVKYYRNHKRAPCGTTFKQQMQHKAQPEKGGFVDYGRVNTLGGSFTNSRVTSLRAGQSETQVRATKRSVLKDAVAGAAAVLAARPSAASLTVDDPRPLAEIAARLESLSGVAITYEDPPYDYSGALADVARSVRGQAEGEPLLVPKGGRFSIAVPEPLEGDAVGQTVRRAVARYNRSGGHSTFAVKEGSGFIHVVPQQARDRLGQLRSVTPVLDTRISLPVKERDGLQLLEEMCAELSAASGQTVEIGLVPFGALTSWSVASGADGEPARDVLEAFIEASGLSLSWRLLYDPGLRTYYLSMPVLQ